jgi:hypothetical protein
MIKGTSRTIAQASKPNLHFECWRKELLTYPVLVLVLCSSAIGWFPTQPQSNDKTTSSARCRAAFTGSTSTPITIDAKMVIPAGSAVTGTAKDAKKAGRFKGGAVLALTLDSITVNGHQYNIETDSFDQASTGKGKRTEGMVVGSTGAGAAIGGLAGGGKGAAIAHWWGPERAR